MPKQTQKQTQKRSQKSRKRQQDMFVEPVVAAPKIPKKDQHFGKPPFVTRSHDGKGTAIDYIRHEQCAGKGCKGCNDLGFTKQLVLKGV